MNIIYSFSPIVGKFVACGTLSLPSVLIFPYSCSKVPHEFFHFELHFPRWMLSIHCISLLDFDAQLPSVQSHQDCWWDELKLIREAFCFWWLIFAFLSSMHLFKAYFFILNNSYILNPYVTYIYFSWTSKSTNSTKRPSQKQILSQYLKTMLYFQQIPLKILYLSQAKRYYPLKLATKTIKRKKSLKWQKEVL